MDTKANTYTSVWADYNLKTLSQLGNLPGWLEDLPIEEAVSYLNGDFNEQAARYFSQRNYSGSQLLYKYGNEITEYLSVNFPFLNLDKLFDSNQEIFYQRFAFKAIRWEIGLLLFKS